MRMFLVVTLALVGCAKTSTTEPPVDAFDPTTPLSVTPRLHTGTLDNGLTWYVVDNPWPEDRVELRLFVKAGSVLEDDDQQGGAHWVEHMAFNGSTHFEGNELIRFLESVGARFGPDLNAYTSFDETVYMLQVPTDDDALVDKGLLVLADWAGGLTFDPDEVEKERGVVLEEWRRSRGASRRVFDALVPTLYHGSRYAERMPIGTQASLEAMEHDALVRFYEDWYRPDLMAVAVVGDIDPEQIVAKIEAQFSGLTGPEEPRPRSVHELPDHDETLAVVESDPELRQPWVQVQRKIDWSWVHTEGAYRDGIVESLFFDMLNNRFDELAQRPDTPFLGARASRQIRTPTRSVQSLGVTPRDGQLADATEAALTEVRRAQVHGFGEGELERARKRVLRGMERLYQERDKHPSGQTVAEIGRHFLTGENMPGIEEEWRLYQAFVPGITADEVNAYAARFLADGRSRVAVAAVPEQPGVELPTADDLTAAVAAAEARDVEPWDDGELDGPLVADVPEPGEIVERVSHEAVGVEAWTLSNGVRVLLKPTDHKEDEVLISAWRWGGTSTAPDDAFYSASVATSVGARSGVGEHDRSALKKHLAGRQVSVHPYLQETVEGVSGQASPADLEVALQLAHLALTAPRFDDEAFRLDLANRAESLRNRDKDPSSAFDDAVAEVQFRNHPRRRSWSVDDLERVDLEQLAAFYGERFGHADGFTFVITGRFEPSELELPVRTWLGSLPDADVDDTWADVGAELRDGPERRVVRAGVEPKARVRIVMGGDTEFSREATHDLDAMGQVLQTRLREKVREELGGTYSIGVWASMWAVPSQRYRVTIQFDCDPDRVEELTAAVYEQIRVVAEAPVDDRYVDAFREQRRRQRELDLKSNRAWTSWLTSYEQSGWPLEQILAYDELLAQTTPERVHESAARWLRPNEALEVVLLPQDATAERR